MQESCKPELVVNRRSDKAMVVICHPDPHSFNHALTNEVQEAWSEAGFNVTLRDLYLEGCNPIITAAEARGARSLDPLVTEHIQELLGLLAVVHPLPHRLPARRRSRAYPLSFRQRSLRRRTTKPEQPAAAWSEAIGSGAAAAAP